MYQATQKQTNVPSLYTGLESFKLLGVNPTKEQISQWQGRDANYEPNYDLVQDNKGQMVRPFHVWFNGETVGPMRIILNIGNSKPSYETGNYQIVTTHGDIVWAKAKGEANPKPEFADHRPLVTGESDLLTIVMSFLKADGLKFEGDQDFSTQVASLKQDATAVYAGDYSGWNKLAAWTNENNLFVSMPVGVKERDVVLDNGSTVTRSNMTIPYRTLNLSKIMFSGPANEWAEGKLTERVTKDPDLIKIPFTVKFMKYDKSKTLNNIPSNPSTSDWSV